MVMSWQDVLRTRGFCAVGDALATGRKELERARSVSSKEASERADERTMAITAHKLSESCWRRTNACAFGSVAG